MPYSRSSRTPRFVTPLAAVCLVASVVSIGAARSPALVALPDTVLPSVAGAHRLGAVDADMRMSLAVDLNLHNADELARLDAEVSTPGSPLYGHYLTKDEFADRFGPTAADVTLVRQFLTSAGLVVTGVSGNRQVVDVTGSAQQVESAFHIGLSRYTDGTRAFYANDTAISLPVTVAPVVSGVIGLDDHTVAQPAGTPATVAAPGAPAAPQAGPAGGMTPTQVNTAYRFSQLGATGAGVTVALWEFDGYKAADLTAYDTQYGLSGPAVSTVSVDNANYDSAPGAAQFEVEEDSEITRAIAPGATQLIYEAPNTGTGGIDLANRMVSDGRASVFSISWGQCESAPSKSYLTAVNKAFSQAVAQGVSIYSASGDRGSQDCSSGSSTGSTAKAVDFPASSVYGTGVGGTKLLLGTGSVWGSETAWTSSGGGVSSMFTKPTWQTVGTGTYRNVPDVASEADSANSFSAYIAGKWTTAGGTSAGAPTWAAFTALYDQKAAALGKPKLGLANPAIYQLAASTKYASTLHDVTSGSNGDYTAAAGYDDVTGWGSPIGDAFTAALLGTGTTTGNTVTVTSPGNQSTVSGTAVNLTVRATDSATGATLTYAATGLPAGLSINASTGVISGKPTTAGTSTVTVTATDTTKATGSASFTWTVTSASCASPGQKLGNPGFESGNTGWTASPHVIGQYASAGEPARTGTWDAWLDGFGATHTSTLSQSVTIPTGCTATLSFYLHVDTDETDPTQYDKLTVKAGTTTLATFSNLDAANGYTLRSYNLAAFAGQTVTLTFTGVEDNDSQTSFVIDDTALTAG